MFYPTKAALQTGLGPVISDGLFTILPFTTKLLDPPPSKLIASTQPIY